MAECQSLVMAVRNCDECPNPFVLTLDYLNFHIDAI